MERKIDPKTEFKCIHCGFPNPIELKYCMACRLDELGNFYPIYPEGDERD